MFRDKEEELQRLQQELLEQEEPEELPEEAENDETLLDEAELDELLKDTRPSEDTVVYQNYSNDYGHQLRNYATGYKAYNTDNVDVDPEELSQQLEQPARNTGLLVTAGVLAAAVCAVACYLLLRYWGIL